MAALLPILAVLAFNEFTLRQSRQEEVRGLALATAKQAALEMERLTSGSEGVLMAVANMAADADFDRARCEAYLGRLTPNLPQFTTIAVLDLAGASRCRSDRAIVSGSFADRTYFQDALAARGRLVVGEYALGRVTGQPGLPLAVAILDQSGAPIGVVVTALDLDWLGEILRERTLAHDASLTIADRDGTIIARQPFPERFIGTVIPDEFQSLVHAGTPGSIELTSQDGTRRILGYIPVGAPPRNLYISAGIATDEAFAAIDAATQRSILLGLAASAVALLLAWTLGLRLVRGPVSRISATLAARRQGDERARTGMKRGQGDLEALGAEIDAYIDELKRNKEEREKSEQTRELLAQEISHRMKNLIATIQAIAIQTLKGPGLPAGTLEAFCDRLVSIGRAQELLSVESTRDVGLREVLATAIGVFEPAPGSRFTLEGPEILLRSQAALGVAMAAHELCTNAVKYGALTTEAGRVEIAWSVLPSDPPTLRLVWSEHGGPPVAPPKRKGFGSRMVESVLAAGLGGHALMDFQETGLRCVLDLPLAAAVGFQSPPPAATA